MARHGSRRWGRECVLGAGLLIALAIALGNCGARGITISARGQLVTAADGYRLLAFELEEDGERLGPARAMLFYVQGSGCVTVLERIEELAGASAMNVRVVFVERRGVVGNKRVDHETCRRSSTKQSRVADHLVVLRKYLQDAPDIPVIVLGASEGGDVAARIAATEPRVTHLALLGTGGGWSQENEIRHFIRSRGEYLGVKTEAELDAVLAEIRKKPDSLEDWAGHPYRRWSSYLWDPPLSDLEKLDIPIFLGHGTRDRSVPVGSARAVRDAFATLDKQNLTYREYRDADHGFRIAGKKTSLLPLIEVDLIRWLAEDRIVDEREAAAFTRRVKSNHPELFAASR